MYIYIYIYFYTKKIKFSIKDFFSKCDQIRSFLILNENFIFCAVYESVDLQIKVLDLYLKQLLTKIIFPEYANTPFL